nr:reverse transcriptase domain-containing protein [Tanacetum cinerariifolium]
MGIPSSNTKSEPGVEPEYLNPYPFAIPSPPLNASFKSRRLDSPSQSYGNGSTEGESLVIQRVLSVAPSKSIDDDSWRRNNIFRTKCNSKDKVCNMINDGGSCENVVSTYMVEKLALKTVDHSEPYQLTWLKKGNAIKVNDQGLRSSRYKERKFDAGDKSLDAASTKDERGKLEDEFFSSTEDDAGALDHNRISRLENFRLVLVLCGLFLYQSALTQLVGQRETRIRNWGDDEDEVRCSDMMGEMNRAAGAMKVSSKICFLVFTPENRARILLSLI